MERAIRGRISAGRTAGELPTDADIDALAGLVAVTFYAIAIKARNRASRTSLRKIVDQTMRAWPRDRTKTERGRRSRTHCDGLDRFACPRHVQVG
jgi:hypothetical protein